MEIKAEEIEYELRHVKRVNYVHAYQDAYIHLPTLGWLAEFSGWLTKNRPSPYVDQKWDCEDFAKWAVVQASLALLRNEDVEHAGHSLFYVESMLNVHEFWNNVNTGFGKHAWCLCKTRDAGWHYLEPQIGKVVEYEKALTPNYDGLILGNTFVWV